MFEKMDFDLTPYGTIRLWAYFKEDEFHSLNNSQLKIALGWLSCWGGWDKRSYGMVSWEFPISLIEYFYEKYKVDSRCDVEYLRKYLGK